jgi:hypothetical protein
LKKLSEHPPQGRQKRSPWQKPIHPSRFTSFSAQRIGNQCCGQTSASG